MRGVGDGTEVAEQAAMRFLPCLVLIAACTADNSGTGADDAADDDPTPDAADDDDPPSGLLDLPDDPFAYDDPLPAHFDGALDNTPADNPITDEGATLGRVLFYDRALSANGTVACASCHDQAHAFADPAQFSTGFEGGLTGRNAMSVLDARFYRNGRFFWDERAATLEEQVLMPIQNEVEMGLTLDELVANVSAQPYYAPLFEDAFGDATVTSDRISRALAQFVRAAVSYRSRYDEGIAAAGDVANAFPNYSASENRGKALFLGRAACAACHLDSGPPAPGPRRNQAIFFIAIATNNGLDATTDVDDNGVGDISGDPQDDGRFKSPSLRNVELTAPYMHDGRLATLDAVIDHYATGVQPHPNLDPRLRVPNDGSPRVLQLSPQDRADLIAFLRTLTDEALIEDVRFSDPFVH
jgi:cytochrome c peroxidase